MEILPVPALGIEAGITEYDEGEIKHCRNVGLDEPEFALTDGFVVTIRRKPELAFAAVGGITGKSAPSCYIT